MLKSAFTAMMISVTLIGCASTKMYDGENLKRSEAAVLFIQSRPNMKFRAIDGSQVNFIYDGKVLEFRPGRHTFEVELSTYRAYGTGTTITYTTSFVIKSYSLSLDMRPGYTYALDFQGVNVTTLPNELCFQGEPHDAPGSSVNPTGEYRKMSATAQSFACVTAHSTRQNNSK